MFAIFGGSDCKLQRNIPLPTLIETQILDQYEYFHQQMTKTTLSDTIYHSLLSGIALGDGRVHSAYKRARLASDVGDAALRYLCESGMIQRVNTTADSVESKLYFRIPFVRFWFAFISPIFKGIQERDYTEFEACFYNRRQEFTELIFKQLCMELLKESFRDDTIVDIGHYWNCDLEIDIIAKTASGKIIAATCKYTHAKIKKSELHKLQQKCQISNINVDIFVMISKRGFTNEVKTLKGENLRLFSVKSFKNLVTTTEDISTTRKISIL